MAKGLQQHQTKCMVIKTIETTLDSGNKAQSRVCSNYLEQKRVMGMKILQQPNIAAYYLYRYCISLFQLQQLQLQRKKVKGNSF
jgi:hypothetical protein